MQVSHSHDHVTHAIIGGGSTIDFGISSSAEFFNILSSTLYKDQILAVVREVLCNAWDAHIEAGCTDKPIIVELENNKFTVKDSGNGIHHDDIGLIYGTYGNSTKKNDGKQTGGFGLGCKAPFAYTEHFEVTSSNDGVRTIYAMSKSSAQVGGKPGITTIAQFPTTERGLSVSIQIKKEDSFRFEKLIKRIAHNGDMNVHFNGEQLKTIDFDTAKSNWMIVGTHDNAHLDTAETLLVRYGNVIYPIDSSHEKLSQDASLISDIVREAKVNRSGSYLYASIIFQAPAHSIAVTPSRESLSMQDHTVNTISKLFKGFLNEYIASFEEYKTKNTKQIIEEAIAQQEVDSLLSTHQRLPLYDSASYSGAFRINNMNDLAKRYVNVKYDDSFKYRKADIQFRVSEMSKAGLISRGLASTYLKELSDKEYEGIVRGSSYFKNDWLQRNVVGKLVSKLMKADLDISNLRVHDSLMDQSRSMSYVSFNKAHPRNLFNCLPYLRNIIVLTNASTDIAVRVKALTNSPVKTTNLSGFLFYVFGRKKGDKEAAQEFFAKSGMTVIDLTLLEAPAAKATAKTKAKPKAKGLPLLNGAINAHMEAINLKQLSHENAVHTETPEFVLGYADKFYASRLDDYSTDATSAITKLFGHKCGICFTNARLASWEKKVTNSQERIKKAVLDYVAGNTKLQEQMKTSTYAFKETALKNTSNKRYLLQSLVNYGIYQKVFTPKNPIVLTEEEKHYKTLFIYFRENVQSFLKESDAFFKLDSDKAFQAFITKVENSTLIKAIDLPTMSELLGKPASKDKALKLFNHALNN